MKVLSLFDGMACGMLAFQKADIEVERYVAYEIDKYAIKVSTHNFPMIEHRGDVFDGDFTEFEGFDFVIGGSPCTYWSIAQKKDARETEASGMGWELFQQYVRAIREAKPKYFIYENNKSMSQAIRDSIDNAFGFEAIHINSALVSAQNRQRLYWVGIRNEDGTYRKANIEQPEDRGILLKDILETGFTESAAGRMVGRRINEDGHRDDYNENIERVQRFEVNENPQKTNCLSTVSKDNMVVQPLKSSDVLNINPSGKGMNGCVMHVEGKSVGLKGNGGGMGGKTGLYAVPTSDIYPIRVSDVYEVKDGQITIKGKQYPIKLADGFYIIRKLTVTECKRLQTVPDEYDMNVISNAQAYKCLGNGWTVDVITHLINGVLEDVA